MPKKSHNAPPRIKRARKNPVTATSRIEKLLEELLQQFNDSESRQKKKKPLPPVLANDPLLGTAQAAEALNISEVHLRRLVRAGKIIAPTVIGDRRFAWRLSDILQIRGDVRLTSEDNPKCCEQRYTIQRTRGVTA